MVSYILILFSVSVCGGGAVISEGYTCLLWAHVEVRG